MQMELRNYERQELIQISLKRQRALMIRDGEKDHMYIYIYEIGREISTRTLTTEE
jgi:hypothetical protein